MSRGKAAAAVVGVAALALAWRAKQQPASDAGRIEFKLDGTTARVSGGDPWGIWGNTVGK